MTTLAQTLGMTPHLSPLLRRLGLATPDSLLRLAVFRGCAHHAPPGFDPAGVFEPGPAVLTDEELAMAMLSAAQAYDPRLIRCAVQLLSGPGIDAGRVLRLARQERCLSVLRHAARAAQGVDTDNPLWARVLATEARDVEPAAGRLPHASRFMHQAGRDRRGAPLPPRWLKPVRAGQTWETCS